MFFVHTATVFPGSLPPRGRERLWEQGCSFCMVNILLSLQSVVYSDSFESGESGANITICFNGFPSYLNLYVFKKKTFTPAKDYSPKRQFQNSSHYGAQLINL